MNQQGVSLSGIADTWDPLWVRYFRLYLKNKSLAAQNIAEHSVLYSPAGRWNILLMSIPARNL
jgi:hypothetical protein